VESVECVDGSRVVIDALRPASPILRHEVEIRNQLCTFFLRFRTISIARS